jgi:hypothetical protein
MIAQIEPSTGKPSAPTYHLKVVLNETKPPVWRRLQVPGNANLGWLHAVLQVAMGWTMGRWGNGDVEVALSSIDQLPYVLGLVRQSFEEQMGNGGES